MDNNKLKGLIATILSASYFGCQPMIMKIVYAGGGNSFTAAMLRFAIPIIICLIYLLINKIDLKLNKKEIKKIVISSLFMSTTTLLLYSSYNFIPTGMATTIHFLYPTFTMLGSIVLYKQKVIKSKLLAIILCLIGILLFFDSEVGFSIIGFILAFTSSITYAYYSIYFDHSKLSKIDPIKIIFYANIISSIYLLIIGLATNNISFTLSHKGWAGIFLVAVLNTFIGVLGYQTGIKYIGAESTAILSTFEPIVSVILGCILYSEILTVKTIFACIAILSATVIIARLKQ